MTTRTQPNYTATRVAAYTGYVTQAIVNNLAPLLFLTFQEQFGLSLSQVTLLVSLNFGVQLVVDLACAKIVPKIGYRAAVVAAHFLAALGLVCMGTLPTLLAVPYAGLLVATVINAVGGGIIEVVISPIIEALPGSQKASAMSLLHSFYCWGHVAVVLLSTAFFSLAGIQNWAVLPLLWAIIPLVNAFVFFKVPLAALPGDGKDSEPLRKWFGRGTFLLLFAMMIASGASEQAMSQWASFFAESGLGVSKTMGDLLGPCLFAVLMGLSRLFMGLQKKQRKLEHLLVGGAVLCMAGYLLAALAPWPLLALAGCALCGLAVGVMWPASFSLSAKRFPQAGAAMFALLALAGDVGCAAGPGVVGWVSAAVDGATGMGGSASLKAGLLAALVFPVLLVLGVALLRRRPAQEVSAGANGAPGA